MPGIDQSVGILRGVGMQRQVQLGKLGVQTVEELLRHYPRDYIDLSAPFEISAAPLGMTCAVRARVARKHGEARLHGGMKLYKVTTADDSGELEVTFFNNRFAVEALREEETYLFYGRVEGSLLRRVMASPVVYPANDAQPFAPCYPLTKGLSNKMLWNLEKQALPDADELPEILPEAVREQYALVKIADAVRTVHQPQSMQRLAAARRRLMFEELFALAVGVGALKGRAVCREAPPMQAHSLQPFYDRLPFSLTGAQRRAIDEITRDMRQLTPANRLVQGDVGSGKTMVAAAAAYFAFCSGGQAALMAPTELLARQHYTGLWKLLAPLGMRVGLLTGSMTAKEKKTVRAALATGEIDLCIGTHALLSEGVEFSNLALVTTDEQHRFGVAQRATLQQKGKYPHTMVMSATPIPRTLALMIYGELDVSVIDELPPGRMPVKTYKISSPKRERAFSFIRERLDRGLQGYIVCPLVEPGEEAPGLRAVTEYFEELRNGPFAGYSLGLLHGKLRPTEKEKAMSAFALGEVQLLVATTVIEVGVDVPSAVVMLIENAERFGLSQLHQLRGRVGRGSEQSHCILLSDNHNPATVERMQTLCHSNDGFALAEYDLRTRGPGNFLGKQQHGLPAMRIADLVSDMELVTQAQAAARTLLTEDPLLEQAEHRQLAREIARMLTSVGGRPN